MAKVRHVPERSCVACGKKLPKRELFRIVKTLQGAVTVDRNGKLAGRGAYLCCKPSCWQRGVEKGGLEHSLKLEISTQDKSSLLEFYYNNILPAPEAAPKIVASPEAETAGSQNQKDTR